MKKTAFLILSAIALYSCGGPDKPKKLLSEKEMENILYDMAMLQAIKSFTPKALDDNKVDSRNYIFKKYKIDSLTLAQNHLYYAHNLEAYTKMQEHIAGRITAEREKITGKKTEVKTPEPNTGTMLPANLPKPGALTPEQRAKAKHKRDSIRAVSEKRLRQAPLNKISPQ